MQVCAWLGPEGMGKRKETYQFVGKNTNNQRKEHVNPRARQKNKTNLQWIQVELKDKYIYIHIILISSGKLSDQHTCSLRNGSRVGVKKEIDAKVSTLAITVMWLVGGALKYIIT